MYEIENGRSYYYSLLMLRYSYNIPGSFEKGYLNIFSVKYTAVTLLKLSAVGFLPMLHLVMSLKDKTGVGIAADLSISFGGFVAIFTSGLFTLRYKKWSEFFTEVTVIKKFQPSVNVEKFASSFSRLTIMYICYAIIGIGLYGILSISEASRCKQLNEELALHEICITFFPIWLPYDPSDIFSMATICTIQAFAGVHTLASGALVIVIVFESTEILILHINILKENFSRLFDGTSNEEVSAKLRFCINYHNHILGLGQRFNTLQKYTAGHVSLMAALVVGCILNHVQNDLQFGAVLYLLGMISAIALYCHAGQKIFDESSSIFDSVYASNWIKADPQTRKDLAFIMLRCQAPLYLSSIPLGTYDYVLFITLLKTSYSYLTLLDGST